MRWGMVIDLRKCYGCNACVLACKQEHFLLPKMFFNHVVMKETGTFPDVKKLMIPTLCNHCADPVCAQACPTGATYQREDGIVAVDADKCTGCQYCIMACPYHQRNYVDSAEVSYYEEGVSPREQLGRTMNPFREGTVVKCTFCMEKIDEGLKKGLRPGIDREATPACVNTCYTKARIFGDLDDPDSEVSRLIKEHHAYTLCPETGARPSGYYID